MTKTVKAFIAADDELAGDRAEFVAMVESLNRVLASRELHVDIMEYDPHRHEEMLSTSSIALVLYHTRCGSFAAKEVDDAYARTTTDRNPRRLYVFFKDDGGGALDEDFVSFRESFVTRFKHFFSRYENVDTLKLNFLLSLENLLARNGEESFVKLDGSKATVDGMAIGDIRKLPMVANNTGLSALLGELSKLQNRFAALKDNVAANPASKEAYDELLEVSFLVNERQEQVDRELGLTFGLAKRMSGVTIGESNEILARARSCMERGKVKEAIAILDSADTEGSRGRLLWHKAEEVDEARQELRSYVSLVELELFRVDALLRHGGLSEADRRSRARRLCGDLLDEITEYRENSSVQLTAEIDVLIEKVQAHLRSI